MINKKAVLIAVLVAFSAAWIAYAVLKNGASLLHFGRGKSGEVEIFVAAGDIPERLALSEAMFVRRTVPKEMFDGNMITRFEPGVYARYPIVKGEILYRNKLGIVKEEPELSYMVDWNQGCISIRVTDVTGVSGLLKPGDYVDVYATFTFSKEQVQDMPVKERVEAITRRILTGLKVVATDKEVLPPMGSGQNFNRARATGDAKRVTLAASAAEIEKLIYAYNKAEIHLALISDAVKKRIDRSSDTAFLKVECVRGDQSEVVYVER